MHVPEDVERKLDALKKTLDEIAEYDLCIEELPHELMNRALDQYRPFRQMPFEWIWLQIAERRQRDWTDEA